MKLRMLAVTVCAPAMAVAAAPPPRPAATVAALTACRSETDPARRLACYDTAVAALAEATARRDVVVLDRAGIQETRRSLFGFALPRIALFGGGDAKDRDAPSQEDISELQTVVTRVRDLGNGKYQVVLAEGGTWQSTEPWGGTKLPAPGAKILIRRAALGSYFLKIDGGRAVRGMRVG